MAHYTLMDSGFNVQSLDKSECAVSVSWSPKGKQLLVGSVNGKLLQYKPDFKLARTILCPPDIFSNNFLVISVYWLFNYQYAAVFLSNDPDATPCLFIVNAPKNGTPTYIKYDDICYSNSDPRRGQVFLQNIPQWNILLMASANSMEVGILGFNEMSDHPIWMQWITTDEARAELPLTSNKEETYPVGFAIETGCTHQLMVGETQIPVMPMIHLLSTHGCVISFDFLNLSSKFVGICSPPRPLPEIRWTIPQQVQEKPKSTEIGFATSTPAVPDKSKAFFSPPNSSKPATNLFSSGITSTAKPFFGAVDSTPKPLFGGQSVAPNQSPFSATSAFGSTLSPAQPAPQKQSVIASTPSAFQTPQQPAIPEPIKPIISVPPVYTKQKQSQGTDSYSSTEQSGASVNSSKSSDDDADIYNQMIVHHIQTFEHEIRNLLASIKNTKTQIGTSEEASYITKSVDELQELSKTASRGLDELRSEIHYLKQDLIESFSMVAEAKYKLACITDPE